jgi:hypothetical protein
VIDYYQYIRSDAWRAVKIRYLKSALPNDCFVCRKPWSNAFHFHHRSYERLGREWLTDIVPVCRPCHALIHRIVDEIGMNLWEATSAARETMAELQAERKALRVAVIVEPKRPKRRKRRKRR